MDYAAINAYTMYCLRCKRSTPTSNEKTVTQKNGRPAEKGICTVCGAKKCQILPLRRDAGLLNKAMNALPLPEMHMRLPKDTAGRNRTDDVLAAASSNIVLFDALPEWERKNAKTVTAIMATKSRFSMGHRSRVVQPW
jgi:hypothetical protein